MLSGSHRKRPGSWLLLWIVGFAVGSGTAAVLGYDASADHHRRIVERATLAIRLEARQLLVEARAKGPLDELAAMERLDKPYAVRTTTYSHFTNEEIIASVRRKYAGTKLDAQLAEHASEDGQVLFVRRTSRIAQYVAQWTILSSGVLFLSFAATILFPSFRHRVDRTSQA